MKILDLQGSAYDIGLAHGLQGKKEVHQSLDTYEELFKGYTSLTWKGAREKALSHVDAIDKYAPEYIEEMEGVAKGASVDFEDILALNARSEIALTNAPDGCTALALTAPRSRETWLAQNWDWKGEQSSALLFLEIKQENKPKIRMVTEGGIIGKIGCNDAGVGVCLNALVTGTWEAKVPIHLGLRRVLDSFSYEEAVSIIDNNQMASPANFLIASKEGKAANFEVSPIYTAEVGPVNGMVIHTNHICSQEMKNAVPEDAQENSYQRLETVEKRLKSLGKDFAANDIFSVLADHDHYPHSICRHEDENKLPHEKRKTVFSIVMDLTNNKLSLITDNPCTKINHRRASFADFHF